MRARGRGVPGSSRSPVSLSLAAARAGSPPRPRSRWWAAWASGSPRGPSQTSSSPRTAPTPPSSATPGGPPSRGCRPLMALGELGVASLKDGVVRFVGQAVSNRPGSVLFSPDSRWLLFVDGYNTAAESGTLHTFQLGAAGRARAARPRRLLRHRQPHRQAPSPSSTAACSGVAALQPGSAARAVATEVSTAQFSPGRDAPPRASPRLRPAARLERVPVEGQSPGDPPRRSVGDWILAPDGRRVAFAVKSTAVKDGRDLWVAALPDGKPVHVVDRDRTLRLLPRRDAARRASSGRRPRPSATSSSAPRREATRAEASPSGSGTSRSPRTGRQSPRSPTTTSKQKLGAASPTPRFRTANRSSSGQRVTTWVWSPDNRTWPSTSACSSRCPRWTCGSTRGASRRRRR